VISIVFPIMAASVVPKALLQREMNFRALAGIDVASYALGYGVTGIALAYFGWGLWALVAAQVATAAVATSLLLAVRRPPVRVLFQLQALKELLSFGAGFSLVRIGNFAAGQGDNVVVGRWLGAEALGVYGRAYQFVLLPANLFGSVVDRVLFPAMASVQQEPERLARAYTRAVALIAMLALPTSAVLLVLAPEIVLLLLGSQWDAVVLPFQILAASLLFRTSYKMSDSLARATGAVYRSAWRQWVYAGAVMLGSWLGHFWGLSGAAAGVAAAIFLHFLLMLHLSTALAAVSWSELGRIHLRYGLLAAATGAACLAAAGAARWLGMVPPAVIVLACLCAATAAAATIRSFPKAFADEVHLAASLSRPYLARLHRSLAPHLP
jgi:O-antigen/teichoic acid export membrane protein